MPDLTEGADGNKNETCKEKRVGSVDDGEVGRKKPEDKNNLSGYLSEGHLEYTAPSGTNPNLERSKLMRKSFHGSAGKMLTAAKVPPPPPLRTTSQLSGPKFESEVIEHGIQNRPQQPLPSNTHSGYNNYTHDNDEDGGFSEQYGEEPQSLQFIPSYDEHQMNPYNCTLDDSPNTSQNFQTVVTQAMVHQEQSPVKRDLTKILDILPSHQTIQSLTKAFDNGIDVVDCAFPQSMRRSPHMFELPPYPSPMNSVNHSRQPSEEFPPPPPPIDLTPLQEELNKLNQTSSTDLNYIQRLNSENLDLPKDSLLAQLQEKRNQIFRNDANAIKTKQLDTIGSPGDTWLKELQAKQAAIKLKRSGSLEGQLSSPDNISSKQSTDNNLSVRNIASRFENNTQNLLVENERSHVGYLNMGSNRDVINCSNQSTNGQYTRRKPSSPGDVKQSDDDFNSVKTNNSANYGDRLKPKKKSVSFCDQVILVATAEDQEDDSYIPNPILERVLKSAMNKPELTTIPLQSEKPSLHRQDSFDSQSSRSTISSLSQTSYTPNEANEYFKNQNYPNSQVLQTRLQQFNAPKNTSPVQGQPVQSPNQIYQALPATSQNPSNPIPYTQPPAVNHNTSSPPNFSHNLANRLTPTVHNPSYITKHPQNMPRTVPNTYPHPPSQLHQANQTPNNTYYHRHPQHSTTPTFNYSQNRQLNQNAQNGNTSYQSVPSNSPAYQSYHNPPTSYANSDYSSRYPQGNTSNQYNTQSLYQRVPPPHGDTPVESYSNGNYQKMGNNFYHDGNSNQTRTDSRNYGGQRLTYPDNCNDVNQYHMNYQSNYNPYQHLPPPKQMQKKSVSFEPGTKGGTDSPIPSQMNGNHQENQPHSTIGAQKNPCNLCRKKTVIPPATYCPDCDFYMSRFKPRS
ncbi:unnamed protein product [Leptosia nina]|uniref:Uncharacterized protein n=1 Tax=Leptosia nina TaxID=320188 RepID=A0AAV1JCY8_9NEOP